MDKQTLSNYGWIVVLTLVLSVMLAIATPLGRFVGDAANKYILAFKETLEKTSEEIDEHAEQNDILLNGSYIITDIEGTDFSVYKVNSLYDGYALTSSGTIPTLQEQYFRCIRYPNVEEKREIKELFCLADMYGFNNTLEERQGVQCVLLQYITDDNYNSVASSLGTIAKTVYDTLLSKKGTLDYSDYKDIHLIAIEKNKMVDMIFYAKLGWRVPKNGQYVMVSDTGDYGKTVYNEFEYLPFGYETQVGDIYTDEDYTYTFEEMSCQRITKLYSNGGVLLQGNKENSWNVSVKDKDQTSYGSLMSYINGLPIKHLDETYKDCVNLVSTPKIPNTVIDMNSTFYNCTSLVSITNIPNAVESLHYTFFGCTALTSTVALPDTLTDMYSTFCNCSELRTVINIPNSVTYMGSTFQNCTSLRVAPSLSENLIQSSDVFYGCSSLTDASAITISNKTLMVNRMFAGCTALTQAPNLENATSLEEAISIFNSCSSLSAISTLPNSTMDLTSAFAGCDGLIAVEIPDTFTSIASKMFFHSEGLTTITLPNTITNIGEKAFDRCTALTTVYFNGTQDEWNAITIAENNEYLTNANIVFVTDMNDGLIENEGSDGGISSDGGSWGDF